MRRVKRVKFKDYVDLQGKMTIVANDVKFDGQFIHIEQTFGDILVPMSNVSFMELAPELKIIPTEDKENVSTPTSNTPRTGKKKA